MLYFIFLYKNALYYLGSLFIIIFSKLFDIFLLNYFAFSVFRNLEVENRKFDCFRDSVGFYKLRLIYAVLVILYSVCFENIKYIEY